MLRMCPCVLVLCIIQNMNGIHVCFELIELKTGSHKTACFKPEIRMNDPYKTHPVRVWTEPYLESDSVKNGDINTCSFHMHSLIINIKV